MPVQRFKLIAELKRWFGLSLGSAGQRTLVSLLATADFKVSRQLPQHKYAKSEQGHLCIPNVLGRTCKPDKPNQAWCGDVTYVWTRSGWLYLAVVIDLFGRRVVGFATAKSPDSERTKKALRMAYESRGKPKGLLFHSDQGCHDTSKSYRQLLWYFGIRQRLSHRGNGWDNAPTERFFRRFKSQWMPKSGYDSLAQGATAISQYITGYYHRYRPHQHNGGLSPIDAEKACAKTYNGVASFS